MSKHDWRLHHSPFSLISISHAPLRPQPRSESRVDRVRADGENMFVEGRVLTSRGESRSGRGHQKLGRGRWTMRVSNIRFRLFVVC